MKTKWLGFSKKKKFFLNNIYKMINRLINQLATDNISGTETIFSRGFPSFFPRFSSSLSIFSQSLKRII